MEPPTRGAETEVTYQGQFGQHWARHLESLFPLHRPMPGDWNYFREGLNQLYFTKDFQSTKSSSHMMLLSWRGSFHLGKTPVSPVVLIDKRSARDCNVFSLHVLKESVLLMLEEEMLMGESSVGGLCRETIELIICVVLSGLSLLRWFHLPTSTSVLVLSPSNATCL